MRRRFPVFFAILLGAVLGAAFLGFMVHAAGRGDPRDLLARWVRGLGATPMSAAFLGAGLGAIIGTVIAWLTIKEHDGIEALCRELQFTLDEEVPSDLVTIVKEHFPGIPFMNPRTWMYGTWNDLDIGLIDCTLFHDPSSVAPGHTGVVRKTVAVILEPLAAPTSFELKPAPSLLRWPFSKLSRWLRAALFGSSVRQRFERHYELFWLGRPAGWNKAQLLLGDEALRFFADHADWTIVVQNGSLAAWQAGFEESDARGRRELIEQVAEISSFLRAAAERLPPAAAERP